jgi:ribosomal protein S18 acetylase RimI-like enzyme
LASSDRPIAIRRATPADAELLAVLGIQVWLDNYATSGIHPAIARYVLDTFTTARFAAMLMDPDTMVLLAERGRHVIALAVVALGRKTDHSDAAAQAEIDRLYVQERFCNAGIGAQLIAAIEGELIARRIDAVWLEVWIENERALHFYARHAFDDIGTAYFELDGKQHENRVLVKRLRGRA